MTRKCHVRFGGGPTEKYRRNSRQLAGGLPYQAAIAALMKAGVTPLGARRLWAHDFVQSEFAGRLIHRRKEYPSDLKDILGRLFGLRQAADYRSVELSERQAAQALRLTQRFVQAVRSRTGSAL